MPKLWKPEILQKEKFNKQDNSNMSVGAGEVRRIFW